MKKLQAETESVNKMVEVQRRLSSYPGLIVSRRRYLAEQTVYKDDKKRILFLFNDLLLETKHEKTFWGNSKEHDLEVAHEFLLKKGQSIKSTRFPRSKIWVCNRRSKWYTWCI